jgi:hypothetical protein
MQADVRLPLELVRNWTEAGAAITSFCQAAEAALPTVTWGLFAVAAALLLVAWRKP